MVNDGTNESSGGTYDLNNTPDSQQNTTDSTPEGQRSTPEEQKNTPDSTPEGQQSTPEGQRSSPDSTKDGFKDCMTAKIMGFCNEPKSCKEIMEHCGNSTTIKYFRRKYVKPLLDKGLLRMTIADKPNSKYQKYITVKN